MQNLTQENFLNNIQSKYPEAFTHFTTWIDDYKKANNWQELFGWDLKFHHLPFAMQKGLICAFLESFRMETGSCAYNASDDIHQYHLKSIEEMFKWMNKEIGEHKTDDLLRQVFQQTNSN